MNQFYLDANPIIAAQYNCNKHIIKIPLELNLAYANLFSLDRLKSKDCPRTQLGKVRGHNWQWHPINKWIGFCEENLNWSLSHCGALINEYKFRYNKKECYAEKFLNWVLKNVKEINISKLGITEHPQCFGEHQYLKCPNDPVLGYRMYYFFGKKHIAEWGKREIPYWLKNHLQIKKTG